MIIDVESQANVDEGILKSVRVGYIHAHGKQRQQKERRRVRYLRRITQHFTNDSPPHTV